jgi:hypothetical protein
MMKAASTRTWAALAGLLCVACSDDFVPYNRLTKLRVLAIASEPPGPATGETATLTPLVYTPEGDPPVSFTWSWCPAPGPATLGYPCLVTEAELGQGGVAAPAFDLGTGPTATFQNTVDPAILQRLCAGIAGSGDKPDCSNGFPVQIRLRVATASDQLTAVVSLNLRFDPATPANRNPRLQGLAAVLDAAPRPIGDDPQLVLPRRVDTPIRADVPEEDAESYRPAAAAAGAAPVRERVTLSWFVESGDPDDGRTGFIENVTTFESAVTNKWRPGSDKDYPPDTARIIVVVRDDRGGVAWRGGAVRLGAAP